MSELNRSSGASPNIEHELMACEHALHEALGEIDVLRSALSATGVTQDVERLREALERINDIREGGPWTDIAAAALTSSPHDGEGGTDG